MEKTKIEVELVEAKILIPKQALEFIKAAHDFGKWHETLEEYLGDQVMQTLTGDLNNKCESLWSMREILKGYGLDKLSLSIDSSMLDEDC